MDYNTKFPEHASGSRRLIESELQPGENIVWLGQPMPGFTTIRSFTIMFIAIPSVVFAVVWMISVVKILSGLKDIENGLLLYIPLAVLPVLLFSAAMALVPWLLRRLSRDTYYVITDRRAIIIQTTFRLIKISFGPSQLQALSVRHRPDGSGDIIFTAGQPRARTSGRIGFYSVGFYSVRNIPEVEGLLMDLAKKPDQPNADR
jgi:hypothetical protein